MADSDTDLSPLCLACGLCCDGSLFGFMNMQPEDGALPLRQGPPPNGATGLAFLQPCTAWVHGACNCYSARPRVCREYDCKTLRAFASGELDQEQAMQRVISTRQRCQQVRQALIAAFPSDLRPSIDALDLKTLHNRLMKLPDKTPEQGRALLGYMTLAKHLDQFFEDQAGLSMPLHLEQRGPR